MAEIFQMILDTCALLWLATGDGKLSRAAVGKIKEAPVVYVSAITGFEVAIKVAKRKLRLPLSPQDWFKEIVEHHGLVALPLTLEVCVAAAELPPLHDDPCDRFIIAAAKLNNWTVVTADAHFAKYGVAVIG